MKKGINAWAFPAQMPVPERMRVAAQAGFDGFELLYEAEGYVGLQSDAQALKEVRNYARELGLELPSLVGTHYQGNLLSSGDPAEAARASELAKRALDAAAVLGVETLLLVPGRVGSRAQLPYGQYDEVYDNALKNVRALGAYAAEAGVHIGVENVWNKFLLSPLEMRAFVDAADSPYIGVYFDVGNVLPWGYPEQWIRILGKRLRKVHFKDFRTQVGTGQGFVDLLSGDLDFAEVMRAFREVGYDGYCTAEVSPLNNAPEAQAYRTAQAMDVIFAMQ